MTVGHFCNREVVITGRESTIVEVAQLMRQHHVGDVVIVEEKKEIRVPVGIITDRDLAVGLIADGVDLDAVTAGDVMSYELVTARTADSIWETLTRMRGQGVRRIPVVNDEGGLEGILSLDDILELLAEELSMLARVPTCAQTKEEKHRE
jgi:CBS domain-containing protein